MSASLPSEEIPRRVAREVADELRGRREMDAADVLAEMRRLHEDELPMPLTGLVNLPIGAWDDFWQEEPVTASGQTDEQQQIDTSNYGLRNERNERLPIREHEKGERHAPRPQRLRVD